ncbi:hypothetical protein SRIMHP_03185 [Streptomyces rimosus subsp. rimosus]|uniref:Uncharacterized protein n=1 Tax=Streptomyces rimosus subsp. rimosus TaxID=132474 RepID=A0ABY3YUX0_STRRM|nr:hypothetical protein SRIMR7_03190 [Streptomyces rimosus subsp. rimosus]UTH93118.1 hypothetical protein SRIMHP_03185 [Streptomyces rimosus subsp. rimosus]UTJ11213.1 hypothetical protein SRIMDV3_03085 [Streptomyces rimosus subsp. rimosus]
MTPRLVSRPRVIAGFEGQRFFIGPGGLPDLRVNACLGSARWRNLGWRSYRDYTYSLGVWLNSLVTAGVEWWEAQEDDADWPKLVFARTALVPAAGRHAVPHRSSRRSAAVHRVVREKSRCFRVACG